MVALPFHSVIVASRHIGNLGIDDFICLGLIALALVVATFVVRGGEKEEDDKAAQAEPRASIEK